MVLIRKEKTVLHRHFKDLVDYLNKGDVLVLNDTAVLPTRMWGMLDCGGQVEATLVNRIKDNSWEALVRPDIGARKGRSIFFKRSVLSCQLCAKTTYGGWRLTFNVDYDDDFLNKLKKIAEVNIPFYIKRQVGLKEYQNVYARMPGSTQCPTAGLHFTKSFLEEIKRKGADVVFLALHIGGSVLPLTARDFNTFRMYKEYFEINKETSERVNKAKQSGHKIIAVGTTVARALETAVSKKGLVRARSGWTDLTIKPDYGFKAISGFLTNFHLPGSSHLLMTSAFGGLKPVLEAYRQALRKGYKFLDFGDAMLIL